MVRVDEIRPKSGRNRVYQGKRIFVGFGALNQGPKHKEIWENEEVLVGDRPQLIFVFIIAYKNGQSRWN